MQKTVLVVDDKMHIVEAVSYMLGKAGYATLIAADGDQALTLIRDERPDLVLLDVQLPGIPGNEVCKLVKDDKELRHTPIILCTGVGACVIPEIAAEAQADGYMEKPFGRDQLLNRVKLFIG